MKTAIRFCSMLLCAAVLALAAGAGANAQTAGVRSRVVDAVDDTKTVRLQGNVHPLARLANDRGAVPDAQPMTRMLLLLQRSTDQEMALRQLIDAQQTKGSGSFHAWLTPAQFGLQYGPSDADVQAVSDWLTKQGFQVSNVAAGRTVVEFNGNAGQVKNAFHTEIHRYVVNGEERFANASDPAIPVALAPVVAGVVALHNFPKHPQSHLAGKFQRDAATGRITALFSFVASGTQLFAVGPADFAKIYNIPATATGAGQSIAIVGQTNVNTADLMQFRSMFGLPAYTKVCPNDTLPSTCQLSIIVNGPDPGIIGPNTLANGVFPDDEEEANLDIEWSGAVAPQAQTIFVTSQTPATTVNSGVDLSALYIVDNNVAAVMSDSYGGCEASLGTSGNAFYNGLWEQAAAEGITVSVATGDAGSAECDPSTDPNAATQGLAVSGLASTPFNVAVGGTDFDDFNNFTPYWSTTNNATTGLSVLGYIPEVPWDDSICAANYLANPTAAPCTSVDSTGLDLHAGGGGASNCATSTTTTCTAGYPKPAFQSALTPADSVRDTPDISLFASDGFNDSFYIVCQSDANLNGAACSLPPSTNTTSQNIIGVGGTSAAAPAFAAIMALVNQSTGQRQGNANYVLYNLAQTQFGNTSLNCNSSSFTNPATPAPAGCVFYDVTKGTNTVACDAGSPNCSNTSSSGFGVITSGVGVDNGNPAFKAVAGYDLATGLGSINVANLLAAWTSAVRGATTTTLGTPSPTSGNSGSAFSASITVTPTPTGPVEDVSLTALASDQKTVLGSFGPFALSNGTVNAQTNLLPPGTAFLQATYGGDASLGASTSMAVPVTVNGTNQGSKTTLSFVTFNSNNNPVLSTGSQNVQYGSSYILRIDVTPSNGTPCTNGGTLIAPGTPCPLGNITLTDNGNALNDWPNAGTANATNMAKVNNQGFAEDQPVQLVVGKHSLVATFAPPSGNTNYAASTSNTLSVTITQANTTTLVGSTSTSITAGTSVTLTAYITTNSSGAGPTGSVTFTNGGTSLGSANCTPTSGAASLNPPISQITLGNAYCTATLTAAVSNLYPMPGGRPGPRGVPVILWIMAAVSVVLFAFAWRWIPTGRKRAYGYAGLIGFALLAAGIAGCGGGSGSSGSGPGTRTIKAAYPGDTNYTSSSGTVNITIM